MAGALVLLVAPVVGALVIWGIWQASQVLEPSTTMVIVEAPRPTDTPLPPTPLPPILVPPTATPLPAEPTPAPPAPTSAMVVNPEPTVAPPTVAPLTIATPAVAVVPPTVAASPAPPVAVVPEGRPSPAASPAPVIAGPPAVASPPPVPTDVVHVVEAGETIARIALRYGVQPDAIMHANGITEQTRTLRIGDRLIVPGVTATPAANATPIRIAAATRTPTPAPMATPEEEQEEEHVYIAEAGDSLDSIAQRFGIPLDALLQANDFDDADRAVEVGERIVIPDADTPPTP